MKAKIALLLEDNHETTSTFIDGHEIKYLSYSEAKEAIVSLNLKKRLHHPAGYTLYAK